MSKEASEKKSTKTIEKTFEELEALVTKMESGDSSLEESFTCYEAGMRLVKECSAKIDQVEKQIMILAVDGGNHES